MIPNKNDLRYMNIAKEFSTWSKDPSTRVGAVVVGQAGQVLTQGYNGFPRGINDDVERWNNRAEKYKYVVHAEMNCIYNASHNGVSLNGATLYVYGLPICSECTKGVIQVGIRRVVVPLMAVPTNWKTSTRVSSDMLCEANIQYQTLDMITNKITYM